MLNDREMLVVKRTDNPALLFNHDKWKKSEDVPPKADVIVFVGRLGRVHLKSVSKFEKAVDQRYMKLKGLRWDGTVGRWCSNGDGGCGKFVINV